MNHVAWRDLHALGRCTAGVLPEESARLLDSVRRNAPDRATLEAVRSILLGEEEPAGHERDDEGSTEPRTGAGSEGQTGR